MTSRHEGVNMEKRVLKISFAKGGSGSISPRTTIPKKWLDALKITQEEREIEMLFDPEKEQIVICKKK